MASADQVTAFQDRGLIKLPGLYEADLVATMRAKVWAFLQKRDGIMPNAQTTWPTATLTKLAPLNMDPVFDPLDGPKLQDALAALVPDHATQPFPGAGRRQTLITFPNAKAWQVPHAMWHTDLPHDPRSTHPTGLQTFICLDEVAPQGGGTLVLTGSHRVKVGGADQIASGKFKKLFEKQSAYAAALFDQATPKRHELLTTTGSFNGVELQPVELTGVPGDLYIMDMRCLHTLSPNVLDKPRLVVTQRYAVTAAAR